MSLNDDEARKYFDLGDDARDWQIALAKKDLQTSNLDFVNKIVPINYRPFDTRYTYYTGKSKGFHCMPRGEIMKHLASKDNLALVVPKQTKDELGGFISKYIGGHKLFSAYDINYYFPLYLYQEKTGLFDNVKRVPNLNAAILDKLSVANGLRFVAESPEKREAGTTYAPIDVLDYIYAVLHTPQYRARYKEFLKIDFPRVPYPKNGAHWTAMVKLGKALRHLHLLDDEAVADLITAYPNGGDNLVGKPKYENGKVWLNLTQYFDNVPEVAWQFYIGGYQPAQKWLKDRVGRTLTFEEVLHYQKMIVALTQTSVLMEKLDALWAD